VPGCLLDVTVWLAAAFTAHPAHGSARHLLSHATAEAPAFWCRSTQQSFLRLASTPLITATYGVPKASNADAWVALEAFLALPQAKVMHEPPELWRHWCQLGAISETASKRWMDAYLAAFDLAAGVQLVSFVKAACQQRKALRLLGLHLRTRCVRTNLGGRLVFPKDHLFKSPTSAAIALLGRTANGWREWKSPQGQTLHVLIRT